MINHVRASTTKLTDFAVGSITRTMLEAPAIEMDQLYQQMLNGLIEGIPTAIYLGFDFERLQPSAAYGALTFTVSPLQSQALVIPQGSRFKVPNGTIEFSTNSELIIPENTATGTVTATANQAGSVGNVIANSITEMIAPITGVTVTNQAGFVTGRDLETDAARKLRFQEFIAALSRGTKIAIEFGAKTSKLVDSAGNITERVVDAKIDEPYTYSNTNPITPIFCYIYNGVGTASAALIAETQKIIDGFEEIDGTKVEGWKGAGIPCKVQSVQTFVVTVTVTVFILNGFSFTSIQTSASASIADYIQSVPIGKGALVSEVMSRIMDIPGVWDAVISAPATNTPAAINTKVIPGVITVSQGV